MKIFSNLTSLNSPFCMSTFNCHLLNVSNVHLKLIILLDILKTTYSNLLNQDAISKSLVFTILEKEIA